MRDFFRCTYSSYVRSNIRNVSNLADAESKAQICLTSESNRTGASDFFCAFTPDLRLWALAKILDPRSQDDRVVDGKHPKALCTSRRSILDGVSRRAMLSRYSVHTGDMRWPWIFEAYAIMKMGAKRDARPLTQVPCPPSQGFVSELEIRGHRRKD